MAAREAATAYRRALPSQAAAAGAPTTVAVTRSSPLTRRGRTPRRAGTIHHHRARTLLRQPAATAVEAVAPRAVMAAVVTVPPAITAAEVAAPRAVVEGVTAVEVGAARTAAVVAAIRIANPRG